MLPQKSGRLLGLAQGQGRTPSADANPRGGPHAATEEEKKEEEMSRHDKLTANAEPSVSMAVQTI